MPDFSYVLGRTTEYYIQKKKEFVANTKERNKEHCSGSNGPKGQCPICQKTHQQVIMELSELSKNG